MKNGGMLESIPKIGLAMKFVQPGVPPKNKPYTDKPVNMNT